MVIATQNPVEYEGTYPLPEAQLDRFALRLSLGYPTPEQEAAMIVDLAQPGGEDPAERVQAVSGEAELAGAADAVGRIHADPALARYVVELMSATRGDRRLTLGASPRAGLLLLRAAKAMALLDGSNHVRAEDVKALAPMVLAHRLLLAPEARAQGVEPAAIVAEVLARVPVPIHA
jgi:MoxR-like ATPase